MQINNPPPIHKEIMTCYNIAINEALHKEISSTLSASSCCLYFVVFYSKITSKKLLIQCCDSEDFPDLDFYLKEKQQNVVLRLFVFYSHFRDCFQGF